MGCSSSPPCRDRRRSGFSLIELSVVLLIIGLIAAAIVVGQNLIRAAEIRSVTTDVRRIQTAFSTFKEKYGALPGDLPTATSYWGSAGGTGSYSDYACVNAQTSASPLTCNGSGDGLIGTVSYGTNRNNTQEFFLSWKQLADAGMFSGSFTGISGPGGGLNAVVGTNVPASRIAGTGYMVEYEGQGDGSVFFAIDHGHILDYGYADSNYETYLPVLTNAETAALDLKTDDGLPGSGTMMTRTGVNSCTTSNDPLTSQYLTATAGLNCSVIFLMMF